MSLRGFQQAFCDLISSPEMCVRLRRGDTGLLDGYELTGRELRRLAEVVRQPGMSVNCTLYRANRVTPLYTMLPRSCALLGDRLGDEASAFWRVQSTDMQFGPEIEHFASFLRGRLASGELQEPYLREMLRFELAVNALRLAPRLRLLAELEGRRAGAAWELHPLVRVVPFAHDPAVLLGELAEGRVPPPGLSRGDFYLALDGSGADLAIQPVEEGWGRLLAGLEPGATVETAEPGEFAALAGAGLLVPV